MRGDFTLVDSDMAAHPVLSRYSVAILALVRHADAPDFVGTGFFLDYAGKTFLASAGHVFANHGSKKMGVGKQRFVWLTRSRGFFTDQNSDDYADAGWLQVDPALPESVGACVVQHRQIPKVLHPARGLFGSHPPSDAHYVHQRVPRIEE